MYLFFYVLGLTSYFFIWREKHFFEKEASRAKLKEVESHHPIGRRSLALRSISIRSSRRSLTNFSGSRSLLSPPLTPLSPSKLLTPFEIGVSAETPSKLDLIEEKKI